ncbi:hypothetical protein BS636_03995 [Acinetobacter sp. LoGeW2-3]|uniref:hypothetical protein n=1 Tax=Acinetobacter sp. LoGeW2-3 TaxID=1808001 RepID=UPI000C05953C|nr:hypothetical protein [Acinetobacter sp. LoGeW2-3]ATO18885.1 hypothetical protein BS636_03995 [Acinetobacter sp. LoGeW2-3]
MKSVILMSLMTAILMSMSQLTMANSGAEKVVRTDRISFYKPMKMEAQQVERIQRTDRVVFNKATLDQPSVQSKRVVRTDRIVFRKI